MSTAFGTWSSAITAPVVAGSALRLGSVAFDGDDLYWVEGRPNEGGRNAVVRRGADGRVVDVTGADSNVRTRVHEYGGAAFVVSSGILYYSEFTDQRLYALVPGRAPEPLTPPGDWYYADSSIDPARPRLVCVREDHSVPGREAVTTLVSVDLHSGPDAGRVLVSGHDFYSTPRFSPDGSRLAWLAWRHPQMPWDGTELWVADVAADGALVGPRCVAGGDAESIVQPGWSPDGVLFFVSDRSGWWNLYRLDGGETRLVLGMEADCGRPQWALGTATWACAGPSRLIVSFAAEGRWRLATLDRATGRLTGLCPGVEPAETMAATPTHVAIVGGSALEPDAIVRIDLATGLAERVRSSAGEGLDERLISVPRAIEFPTEGGLTAHAFFYPPHHPGVTAPAGQRPPLIIISHGGPTGATHARLNLEVQYWTSRGFAVADVNYGGSTGFGRAYRRRLNGRWGIVDVADCVNAARYLAAQGEVDGDRLIIRGRSAGGYTTLAALAFRPEVFKAGASYYGVGDLERLAEDTHKFESRYLDRLIGPYPEAAAVYRARSPVHVVERLSCPLILFQGLEDRVVPPNQARMMADAVRAKGLPVALITFEGEQHGFRRAETIVRCLETELFFYGAVFGFTPAGTSPDFTIDNLEQGR